VGGWVGGWLVGAWVFLGGLPIKRMATSRFLCRLWIGMDWTGRL
jgi:hypothetical protein